jgi:DNA repair protein RadC
LSFHTPIIRLYSIIEVSCLIKAEQKALELNAAALILAHNHPSGIAEPSSADQRITTNIKEAMEVFDVKVLDHFIVSPDESCSFAMRGML